MDCDLRTDSKWRERQDRRWMDGWTNSSTDNKKKRWNSRQVGRGIYSDHLSSILSWEFCPPWSLQGLCHQLLLLKLLPKLPNTVSALTIPALAPACQSESPSSSCSKESNLLRESPRQSYLKPLGPRINCISPIVSHHEAILLSDGIIPGWHSQSIHCPYPSMLWLKSSQRTEVNPLISP